MKAEAFSSANSYKNKTLINLRNTGYFATTSIGLTMASGLTKNKTLKKSHKVFAWISVASVLLHIFTAFKGHRKRQLDFNKK